MRATLLVSAMLTSLVLAAPVRAQPAPAPSSNPPAPAETKAALLASIEVENTELDRETIRAAIESELRVAVETSETPPPVGLKVKVRARRATVAFTNEQRQTTTRTLELPLDRAHSAELIALLAGNLARNEASELLTKLRPAPEPTPPPSEPAAVESEAEPAEEHPAPPATEPSRPTPQKQKAEAPAPAPKTQPTPGLEPLLFNLTFFHPITLFPHTEQRELNFEFGFAYSRIGALDGLALTIGAQRVEQRARGVVVSVFWTRVGGDMRGLELGAIVSESYGDLRGVDVAGITAFRSGDVNGLQSAGIVSLARDVHGADLATVAIAHDVEGFHGGAVAVAHEVDGVQAAAVSVSHATRGLSMGVVNVAREVHGLQLGLVNVDDQVKGEALGLVTIAKNGRVQPTAWDYFGGGASFNLGVKFAVNHLYSQLAVGKLHSTGQFRDEVGGGYHTEFQSFKRLALDLGVHVSETYSGDGATFGTVEQHRLHYRAGLDVQIADPLWLRAGFDLSHDLTNFGTDWKAGPLVGLALF